jgi:hypothetical protein
MTESGQRPHADELKRQAVQAACHGGGVEPADQARHLRRPMIRVSDLYAS